MKQLTDNVGPTSMMNSTPITTTIVGQQYGPMNSNIDTDYNHDMTLSAATLTPQTPKGVV